MNDKRILEAPTHLYDKLPKWLFLILTCLMVYVFEIVGAILEGIVIGAPIAIVSIASGHDIYSVFNTSLYLQLSLFLFISLLVLFWVWKFEKRPISSLGLFKGHIWLQIFKGWGLGTLVFSLAFAITYIFGGLNFDNVDFSWTTILYALSLMPFWFIQSGTEELLTRGWLMPLLNKRFNLAIAVGVSSSLFGILHLGNGHVTFLSILSIILSGVFMALYTLKTDNLWAVSAFHAAWNFTQGNIYGVAVSGTESGAALFSFSQKAGTADWISGGAFGTEGSLLTSIVLLLGSIYLAWQLMLESKVQD
ncbi:CPBP family intramembrane glutamic endopeptidase [Streptococcus dentiloxodontae]